MSSGSQIWQCLCLSAACLVPNPTAAWVEVGAEIGLEINEDVSHTLQEINRTVQYSAARLDQRGLKFELVTLNALLDEEYENYGPDNVLLLQDGAGRVSIRPTVATAWSLLKDDPDIVGIVPIGFSEVAGSADLAGFIRSDSWVQESIFSAANLDTLLCLNDVQYVSNAVEEGKAVDYDLPFLFQIKPHFASYRYLDNQGTIDAIDLDAPHRPKRFQETFELCEYMIQTGFRVIDPVHILKSRAKEDRFAYDEASSEKQGRYPLNVMVFDREGRFSFVHFSSEVSPYEAGLAISSDKFFGEDCKDPVPHARSCEIWAVTVSAFDRAGMVFRPTPDEPQIEIGGREDLNVISPAVLILRRRE